MIGITTEMLCDCLRHCRIAYLTIHRSGISVNKMPGTTYSANKTDPDSKEAVRGIEKYIGPVSIHLPCSL